MMLQGICFKNLSQNYFPYYKIGYGEVDPYHIYISIITIISKDLFFAATKWNFLVTIYTVIFPIKCPYRFSDNNKI
jgi:hypothetical protein